VNTSLKVFASSAFLDYATREDRENSLSKALETSKEEKNGSFGKAVLRPFRSRGKRGETTFSMGIKGFTEAQTPTEDDLKKIYSAAPISRISIIPPRSFAFVDFDQESSLAAALTSKVTLPGMKEPLEVETSKHGPQA